MGSLNTIDCKTCFAIPGHRVPPSPAKPGEPGEARLYLTNAKHSLPAIGGIGGK